VDTTDWECETGLGGTAVMDDVSLRPMELDGKNALFWMEKARRR